jgi:glycosyltransferase involved in cell wall biosynthesis
MSTISVIIPYRNAEKYILRTIDSLLSQTITGFELVFVDNGSTDDSHPIVDSLITQHDIAAKHLHFSTAGKALALNYAIANCAGDWLAICDADDLWDHDKLQKQVSLITSDVDIIGTQMRYIDANDSVISGAPALPLKNSEIYHSILYKRENPICNSSVIYRKRIHTDIVGFYDPLCAVEDYDLWSRCVFSNLTFANISEQLVSHRLHDESNFNSSQKQAFHKQLVDIKNDMMQKIRSTMECDN